MTTSKENGKFHVPRFVRGAVWMWAAAMLLTPPPMFLTDRTENQDQVEYSTEPSPMKTAEDFRREERMKEERSWQMLDNLEIFPYGSKDPRSSKSKNNKGQ